MKKKRPKRLCALILSLTLALTPAAHALTVEQAGELLQEYYIDPVPEQVLEQDTVAGMVAALGDPYTAYFTAEEYASFENSMTDISAVGTGLLLLFTQEGLLVDRAYEGLPGAQAGIQAGDLIIAIDGWSVLGAGMEEVNQHLVGEAGSVVEFTLLRAGEQLTIAATRQALTLPATYTELWDGHIGYIDCDTFGAETLGHFQDGLETYADAADRWIVDLRQNGGGSLDACLDTASCFNTGALLHLQDRSGRYETFASQQTSLTDAPVIVLTDGGSASASELFAAFIRDANAGILVGERTYGKGVAQLVFDQASNPDYFPEGDALKVTVYRIYSAGSGTTADTIGVIPHLLVEDELAPIVAQLLSAPTPQQGQEGMLRVELGWRWYVDLEQAMSQAGRAAFVALLEALPPSARVQEGTASGGWTETTAADLAEKYGLTEYTPRGFSDVAGSPYEEDIQQLATYGLINGMGDGTFHPQDTLTRAQACALLAQVLHCALPEGESIFSDVDPDIWDAPAVNAMAGLGLVEGVGNGRFDPEGTLTQQQLITILDRLGSRLNLYLDSAELLWDVLEDGQPQAAATREETAALTCTLLERMGILPD